MCFQSPPLLSVSASVASSFRPERWYLADVTGRCVGMEQLVLLLKLNNMDDMIATWGYLVARILRLLIYLSLYLAFGDQAKLFKVAL